MTDRRDFLKKSAQVAAAVAAANAWKATGGVANAFAAVSTRPIEEIPDSTIRELMMTGLNAAKSAGAAFCCAMAAPAYKSNATQQLDLFIVIS